LNGILPQKFTMTPELPIIEFDPAREAIIEPSRLVKPIDLPNCAVACFFLDAIRARVEAGQARQVAELRGELGPWPVYELEYGGGRVALFHPGIGASLAAITLEEVIALGCHRFVAVGGCGVLDKTIAVGHLLVPTAAVRDEGTSYHYLPPNREVAASPEGVAAIERVLERHGLEYRLSKTWTTDAPYRETPARAARRKAEGCLAVEMEAAAFFAVAAFRGVPFAQILYGGDAVIEGGWDGRAWNSRAEIRSNLIDLGAEACLEMA
jgi:uridine phosphorylase